MTHDEYAKRLAAAVEAFCVAHPWARGHQEAEVIGGEGDRFEILLHRRIGARTATRAPAGSWTRMSESDMIVALLEQRGQCGKADASDW